MRKIKLIGRYIIYLINKPLQNIIKTHRTYVTCVGNIDGIGAQVHALYSTLLFAEIYKLTYIHSAFTRIEHNSLNMNNWESRWENYFSIGYDEIKIDQLDFMSIEKKKLEHPLMLWKKSNVLFEVRNCHELADLFPDRYEKLRERFRMKFNANQKNTGLSGQKSNTFNIAVHLRRGDVTLTGKHSDRYTNPELVKKVLGRIIHILDKLNIAYSIALFSQGKEEDFKMFKEYPVNFQLNQSEFDTFTNLVFADALLMAKSSFSYAAALLNEGVIFYDEFWHKPLKTWIPISNNLSEREIGNILLEQFKKDCE